MKKGIKKVYVLSFLMLSASTSWGCELDGEVSKEASSTPGKSVQAYKCHSGVKLHDNCVEGTGAIAGFWLKVAKVFNLT